MPLQVLDAIRDSRRPVVGHNPTLDLAHTLASFVQPLPRSWAAYKAALARAFPGGLYDTKHIAQQLAAQHGMPITDTALGGLYDTLMNEQWLRSNAPGIALGAEAGLGLGGLSAGGIPAVVHAPGFDGYVGVASGEKAHEAGWDAFMTGAAFARLLRIAEVKAAGRSVGEVAAVAEAAGAGTGEGGADATAAALSADDALLQPLLPYRGRLHFMRADLPYWELSGNDPPVSRPTVVHLSNLIPGTKPGFVAQRFQQAGLGPVHVSLLAPVRQGDASTTAFIQLPRADYVSRAVMTARKRWGAWVIVSYAEYQAARREALQQGQGQGAGRGDGAGAGARTAPKYLQGAAAGGSGSGGSGGESPEGGQRNGQQEGSGGVGTGSGSSGRSAEREGGRGGRDRRMQTEKQRLVAFTKHVAAAATGLPRREREREQGQSDGDGVAGGGMGSLRRRSADGEAEAAAAAAADGEGAGGVAAAEDRVMTQEQQEEERAKLAEAKRAQEEAVRQAAERLRGLAAVQRSGGGADGAGPGGAGGRGGAGLERPVVRRPGR